MTKFQLSSPRQADEAIARFFASDKTGRIEVFEETAFGAESPLALGSISLKTLEDDQANVRAAVRNGSFEWLVPDKADVSNDLHRLLGTKDLKKGDSESATARISNLLDDMTGIAVRLGLIWPRFDAVSVAEMPFIRPVTVVADTSGVLQGALTFIAEHLHPTARVKIPAVLHMEVVNQADRFMKSRRSAKARKDVVLAEHLLSQTGQRALLRLELRQDTEIERNLLIGDPLRIAFKEDRDPDLKELNLNVPLRSYVDRMILESARQHQAYASPGHPVYLLTGDQGLARMALAEGINPLFFKKMKADQFFGLKLSGANFSPFNTRIISTPISAILWELATAFGRARLVRDEGDASIDVTAIDKELGWSAFHSQEDLLWFRTMNLPQFASAAENNKDEDAPPASEKKKVISKPSKSERTSTKISKVRLHQDNRAEVAFYRLNLKSLVALIDKLSRDHSASDENVGDVLELRTESGLAEYRRFLLSGELIEDGRREWVATDRLVALGDAQREHDLLRMVEGFSETPSFAAFLRLLQEHSRPGDPVDLPIPRRVLPFYLSLGELTGVGMSLPSMGYFATSRYPNLREFVELALQRYRELAPDNGWVSVGEWLELLARKDGVHPVRSRENLQEAAAANLIRRYTEGSTTDTRHDDHTLRILQTERGVPTVNTVHLYRGDFLIPDKSSSSLRLEGPAE